MRDVLLDADAFRCLRELGLLEPGLRAAAPRGRTHLVQFVARHELSLVSQTVEALEKNGLIVIESVLAGSEAGRLFRKLMKEGHDKGESESIAWASGVPQEDRPVFVTADRGATRLARDNRVPVTDVFGLVLAWVELAGLDRQLVADALTSWDQPHSGRCGPKGWAGFEHALRERRADEIPRFGTS